MKESAPQNPFELVDYDGVLVPELLTHADRENDLNEYIRGWNDQAKSPSEQIVPKIGSADESDVNKLNIRSADNWYKAGAARRYGQFDDHLSKGTGTQEHEKDIFSVMEQMRANPDLIPHDAWLLDDTDEETDSSKARFS